MNLPVTMKWIGLALLGLAIAAGVAIAASSLASQQIGLASEPISAGDSLAPASQEVHRDRGHPGRDRRRASAPSNTATTTETAPSEPAPTGSEGTPAPREATRAPAPTATTEAPMSPAPNRPIGGGSEAEDLPNGSEGGGSGADD